MARLRHLVVVLPGIGGSVLAEPGSPAARGVESAEGITYGLTPRGLAHAVGSPSSLADDRDLVPLALVRDFAVLPPLWTLPGYQRLRLHLHNTFRGEPSLVIDTFRPESCRPVNPKVDVLLVPYDFRLSVVDSATRVAEAVTAAARSSGERRVIVVAHSLGGLVARQWITAHEGWRVCRAVITLGTPFRGAPKALDWLVNGAGIPGLRHPGLTGVLRGWRSVYELLPQYDAVWDETAKVSIELTTLPASLQVAKPNPRGYLPQFTAMSAAARAVHDRLRESWAELLAAGRAPATIPFFTRGHPTPNLVTLARHGRLGISKEDPLWRGNVGWAGDGTVPMLSAIPVELGDEPDRWRVLAVRHGSLGSVADAVTQVSLYEGNPVPVLGGPLPEEPWLGLDLDEFTPAGAATPLAVRLQPDGLSGTTCAVTVAASDGAPTLPWRSTLAPAGDGVWRGELPPREPGRYAVTVQVTGVAGQGTVAAGDTLVAVDVGEGGWPDAGVDEDGGVW